MPDGGQFRMASWPLGPVLLSPIALDVPFLQDEEPQRPAPLHAPGKRSQLVLFRARADYGCVWTTYVKRTDAPVVFSLTRITRREVGARNRWARFPAAHCGGALRIAPAAETPRPAGPARSDKVVSGPSCSSFNLPGLVQVQLLQT